MSDEAAGLNQTEPALTPYTAPPPPRSGALVGLGAAVAALLVASVFAVVSIAASGGSSSPEAAVESLFRAVENEDVLGLLEALPPGERRAIQPGTVDIVEELQRLGVLSDDLNLRSLSGLDLDVEGLALQSEALADGISAVTITGGTITMSSHPDELPLGPVVRDFLDDPEVEPETETEDLAGDARIIAIEEDGGWHVSLFYSIAEAAREAAGRPLPDFGAGIDPVGSSSPQAVVEDLAAAAGAFDLRGLIALIDPAEGRALYDYAPLFLDEADRAIAEMQAEGPFELSVFGIETSVEERSGDTAVVVIEAYEADFKAPDGPGEVIHITAIWDGECSRVAGVPGEEPQEVCLDDLSEVPLDFDEMSAGIVVVEHDGRWFFSPTRTMLDAVVEILGVFDREDLEDPEALFESFMGVPFMLGAGGAMGGVGGFGSEEAYEFEEVGPPVSDEDLVGEGPGDFEAYQRCFEPLEELSPDASPEEWEAAQRRADECVEGLHGS